MCTAAVLLGYRASLDALKDSCELEANLQCSIFEYMRYLNAIIHSISSGRFISNNPKLFLATLGIDSGRPLALTPTLPFHVRSKIVSYLPGLRIDAEDTQLPVDLCQNVVTANFLAERVDFLKESTSMKQTMLMCSCGMGFFGCARINTLHKHLTFHPTHNSDA